DEYQQDDQLAKDCGIHHFRRPLDTELIPKGPGPYFVQAYHFTLALGNLESDVFHDDHGPVDDDPKINGPQAQQVGIHPEEVHHAQGEHQAEGDDRGHYQAGTPVPQQEDHYKDHDQTAQDQILGDGVGRPAN